MVTEDKLRANGKGWRQAQYSATSLMMMMMILVALDSPTKTFKGVFCNPMYFFIFLQCTVTENLNQMYNL